MDGFLYCSKITKNPIPKLASAVYIVCPNTRWMTSFNSTARMCAEYKFKHIASDDQVKNRNGIPHHISVRSWHHSRWKHQSMRRADKAMMPGSQVCARLQFDAAQFHSSQLLHLFIYFLTIVYIYTIYYELPDFTHRPHNVCALKMPCIISVARAWRLFHFPIRAAN